MFSTSHYFVNTTFCYVNQESEKTTDRLFNTPRTDHYYRISFEGLVFIKNGGYENEFHKSQSIESLKNEMIQKQNDLEEKQSRNQTQLVVLTWVIALGTLIAGVYYFLEILDFFGTFSCDKKN